MRKSIYYLFTVVLAGLVVAVGMPQKASAAGTAKNVILIIGDGMGPQQVGLLLTYARQAPNSVIKNRVTAFDRMMEKGVMGISMHYANGVLVTDSAASATQLASGVAAGSEMIGVDKDGNPTFTVLERAKKAGKSTGLVSDTRVTHATPAAFAAHQTHRSQENAIAVDMLNTGPDVMLGGGLRHWIPKEANDKTSAVRKKLEKMTEGAVRVKSKRKDSRNLIEEAMQKGYRTVFTKSQMEQADGKILGLFHSSAMNDGIRYTNTKDDPNRTEPTLKEMSAKALDVLSKNPNGFFLMIEAGLIDWAGHYNDTGTMLHEMLKFNETLNYVLDWTENRNDTLIVVTADHESGGFGFSYSANDIPAPRQLPGSVFQGKKFSPLFNFGDPAILDKLYNQKLSYADIFYNKFDRLPKDQQTPSQLMKLVNQYTEFKITEAQAATVLATEPNPYYVEGHQYLSSKTVPKMDVNDAFFVYQWEDNRENLLAQQVSNAQSVVWSTGTHTSTPVLVFAQGPIKAITPFSGILHHTLVGQFVTEALVGPQQ